MKEENCKKKWKGERGLNRGRNGQIWPFGRNQWNGVRGWNWGPASMVLSCLGWAGYPQVTGCSSQVAVLEPWIVAMAVGCGSHAVFSRAMYFLMVFLLKYLVSSDKIFLKLIKIKKVILKKKLSYGWRLEICNFEIC